MTDDFDVLNEGVIVHKGRFIEKNRDAERVQEKRCKRCKSPLTYYEDEVGSFRLWCLQCNIADSKLV